ncbi:MAG: hypothetical protein JO040_06930 [Gemmatimonadetes bacterium]|nr:hypothetical protein [Gemmatimonadota bacterium]
MPPIWIEDVIFFILVTIVLLVPVIGITARFAVNPIVEALIRFREAFLESPEGKRFADLEAEVCGLRSTVDRLTAEVAFDRQLRSGGEPLNPDAQRVKAI